MPQQHTSHDSTERAPYPGVFVTLEGGDGTGKSTQARLLAQRLEACGYTVCSVHEPGGTQLGERVRAILLDTGLSGMGARSELLLFEAARAQLVDEVIVPHLRAGHVVISDRFFDSTVAYQGYGRGIALETVGQLNAVATAGIVPDRTVLLQLDASCGVQRACGTGGGGDRMERAGEEFHERVAAGFERIAADEPERVRVVDARGSVEDVRRAVWRAVADLFEQVDASASDEGLERGDG